MKRIFSVMMVIAVAASMAMAATNEVTSVNIVGYNKADKPASGNFNLISVQFDAFDPTLMGVFGTNQLTAGNLPFLADRVYIYDPAKDGVGGYWQYAMKATDKQFYDANNWGGSPTNPPIPAGTGLWIQTPSTAPSGTVTIAGEVVDVATQSVDVVTGFQILGYPYSAEVGLNTTDLANDGATKGAIPNLGDRIYVWNGVAYDQYALKSDGQWYDAFNWGGPATTNALPLGVGFWYQAKNPFTWTEPIPYADALQ